MPLREQIERVNWLQLLLNALSIAAIVAGGLFAAARVWGDNRWTTHEKSGEIALAVAERVVATHEASPKMHPASQTVSDRLDERYVSRREYEKDIAWLRGWAERIESKMDQ